MTTKKNKIEKQEKWFYDYIDKAEIVIVQGYKKYGDYFLCPCCGYPTLTERGGYDICPLCFWEDDGQDDHNADEIFGGPNSDYSLTEARQNFRKYYTMYRPADKNEFEMTTIKKNHKGKVVFYKVALKKRIIKKYHKLVELTDIKKRKRLWSEIKKLERKLI